MLKNFLSNHLPSYFLGLIVFLGLVPQSGDNPLILAPTLLLCVFLILGNRLTKIDTKDPMLLTLLLLWLVWGATGLASAIPFPTKITWVIFAALPLTYLYVRTTPKIDLTIPLTVIGTGLALYAGYHFFIHHQNRPDWPFDDTNLLGLTFVFAALASLSLKPTRFLIPVLVIGIILTESRTALLALLMGFGTCALLSHQTVSILKNKSALILGLVTLALTIPLIFTTGFDTRLISSAQDSSERFSIWTAAWDMAWEHPWTGFGLGTFHLYYPPFRLAGDHDSLGWMVHMEPLQFAVESGWLSTLLLYVAFILAALKTIALRKNKTLESHHIIAASILTALFVSIHLTYPLHVVGFMMIFGFALATLYAQPTLKSSPLIFSIPMLLTLLGIIWLGLSGAYTFLIWNNMQTAYHLHDQPRFNALLDECLDRGDPDFPDCRLMAARFMSLAQNSDTEKIKTLLDRAESANPVNAEIPYLRARTQLVRNPAQTQDLLPLLDESLARNPTFWPARKMAINILLSAGEKEKAKAYLEKGLIYPYPKQTRTEMLSIEKMLKN